MWKDKDKDNLNHKEEYNRYLMKSKTLWQILGRRLCHREASWFVELLQVWYQEYSFGWELCEPVVLKILLNCELIWIWNQGITWSRLALEWEVDL